MGRSKAVITMAGQDAFQMKGLKCLVTGGTKGIGRSTVEAFASLGAEVFTCSRNSDDVDACLREWREKGYEKVHGGAFDLSDPESREGLVARVKDVFDGRLDVLVNNVGINIRKKTEEFSLEDYNRLMNVNLESTFHVSQLCLPLLKASGCASVVMNSSVAGGPTTMRSGSLYGMSKGGMNQLTKILACEWAPHGIRCNAVAPWYTNTPLANQVLKDEAYKAEVLSRTPMGRTGEPEEVANTIAFLCMPAAGFITGQILAIDGGYSSMGFW